MVLLSFSLDDSYRASLMDLCWDVHRCCILSHDAIPLLSIRQHL